MSADGAARVGVVFVNYHSEALIVPRVTALERAGFALAVADNSGTYPDSGFPVTDPGVNLGFGTACNRAVGSLDPGIDIICFHNPDVDISPAAILRLVAQLRRAPNPGLIAPIEQAGPARRSRGYHRASLVREALLAARTASRVRGRGEAPGSEGSRVAHSRWHTAHLPGPVFGSAALLLASRGALDAVGGFDERYFMYGEDLDLWVRVERSGAMVGFSPDVVAVHGFAAGSPMASPSREVLRWLGIELFAQKFWRHGTGALRSVHRWGLRAMGPAAGDLGDEVGRLWADGESPARVLDRLRPTLEDRARA